MRNHRPGSRDSPGFDYWIDRWKRASKSKNQSQGKLSCVSGRSEVASGAAVGGPWSASGSQRPARRM